MFQTRRPQTRTASAANIAELVYHAIVRNVRKTHGNPLMSLALNIFQTVMFVAVFYAMFSIMGLRGMAIRGDFLIYIMTGVFLYLTHTKTIAAVVGSEGPSSPMMQHAPMNTIVSILAAALGTLYIQVLSMLIVLFAYHVAFTPFEIEDPVGAFAMIILSWFSGIGIGMLFLSLKPWFPQFVSIASSIYQRANMIASGKMFVANTLPSFMLAMFDWNPLFHTIDQSRGYTFINYVPRYTDWHYPLWLGVVMITIGLMGEFYTRQRASLSWEARR